MRFSGIKRAFFFIVFFSIGGAAISVSVLGRELFLYVGSRGMLASAEAGKVRLEQLNTDYDILLRQLQTDPNIISRIAPAVLGESGERSGGSLSKQRSKELERLREVLSGSDVAGGVRPVSSSAVGSGADGQSDWLRTCIEIRRRTVLFLAGSFLVLISFIWFGPVWSRGLDDV